MTYVKFIKSGNNLEIYEYEHVSSNKGRPKGYKVKFTQRDISDSGGVAFQQAKQKRRTDNARRASMAFKRLVLSNLGSDTSPLLLTFTYKENETDVRHSSRAFKLFVGRMRKFFGKDFRYVGVPEFQKRGAIHYHALFWGLPSSVFQQERKLRTVAKLWQKGFVDIVQTDGHAKIASYLAKYMVKAICDPRLASQKAYFASRNMLRPVQGGGIPLWFLEDEYELGKAQLLHISDFVGQWTGKGRYRLFNLDNI